MKRRLCNVAVALSLLLCMASVVMWIRSYYVHDLHVVEHRADGMDRVWASGNGRFGYALSTIDPTTGKRIGMYEETNFYLNYYVCWFATVPIAWLVDWSIRHEISRYNPHACPNCGYDLRETPTQCPECGVVPEKSSDSG